MIKKTGGVAISILGSATLGVAAFSRGEPIQAISLVIAAAAPSVLLGQRFTAIVGAGPLLGRRLPQITVINNEF